MADDSDPDRDVLSSLPRTRPSMRSARRDAAKERPAPASKEQPSAKPAGAKPKPARTKAKATPAKAKAKPKPKAKVAAKPKAAAGAAGAKRAPAAAAAPPDDGSPAASQFTPRDRPAKPRRKVPPAGYAPPRSAPQADHGPPNPAEIVTTAVQAGVELTQIGLTVSRQALKSVVDKLPRP